MVNNTRKGYTLVEVAVCGVIILVLATLTLGLFRGCGYYQQSQVGIFQCVKTYTVTNSMGEGETTTSKRVDLRPQGGGPVETFTCDDNLLMGIHNSATLYAQFEPGKWYQVESTGYRKEFWSIFPNITSVSEIPNAEN